MRFILLSLTGSIILFTLGSCMGTPQSKEVSSSTSRPDSVNQKDGLATLVLREDILMSASLDSIGLSRLTPESILDTLMNGNHHFASTRLTIRNNSQRVRHAAQSHYPMAIILSCMDSRLPVEDIFHRGSGDLFVLRVAGNVVDNDMLGSMEYGCKFVGTRLIMVLGHENCGVVKSAINDVNHGNLTPLLSKIQPAVNLISKEFDGEKEHTNPDFVKEVCHQNVLNNMESIRKSPFLRELEETGKLKIVGAVYDTDTGKVVIL